MADYQKLYTLLFNAITNALEDLANQNYGAAQRRLQSAQIQSEVLYIAQTEGDQ